MRDRAVAVVASVVTPAAVAISLACAPAALAQNIQVNTRADEVSSTDGSCSLREAVAAANSGTASGPGPGECPAGGVASNTIILKGGAPYVLTKAGGGALHITSALAISGAGSATTTIAGGAIDRVLDVGAAPAVSIRRVTIGGGHAPDGTDAAPTGSFGGGIRNIGVLTLVDARVKGNRAGDGLAGSADPAIGRAGAAGGPGGGVYNSGTLTLIRSTVVGNHAGAGGRGVSAYNNEGGGIGGQGGAGGGIYNASGAILSVVDSSITSNAGGTGGTGGDDALVGGGGSGGSGGGGGSGGAGGGLWNAGTLTLARSAITGDAAGRGGNGGGNGGVPSSAGGPGAQGGLGGGVFDDSATSQTIANSTISANAAGSGGDGENGGYGGDGGGGGGVVSANAAIKLLNVTVSANQVGSGGGDGGGGPGGIGGGGGVTAYGSATLQNTIVAGNGGGNCLGAMTDAGHNLSFPDTTCPGINRDPLMGPLQLNGGLTRTQALHAGSPAIDKVPATRAGCPATDQRGVHRPQGLRCEIGAFEFAKPLVKITSPKDGAHYKQGKRILAAFRCTEAGLRSLIASCVGTVSSGRPIKTAKLGRKSFTVTAIDKLGNRLSKTVHYKVKKRHPKNHH